MNRKTILIFVAGFLGCMTLITGVGLLSDVHRDVLEDVYREINEEFGSNEKVPE